MTDEAMYTLMNPTVKKGWKGLAAFLYKVMQARSAELANQEEQA